MLTVKQWIIIAFAACCGIIAAITYIYRNDQQNKTPPPATLILGGFTLLFMLWFGVSMWVSKSRSPNTDGYRRQSTIEEDVSPPKQQMNNTSGKFTTSGDASDRARRPSIFEDQDGKEFKWL
jgi:hypothetical protein